MFMFKVNFALLYLYILCCLLLLFLCRCFTELFPFVQRIELIYRVQQRSFYFLLNNNNALCCLSCSTKTPKYEDKVDLGGPHSILYRSVEGMLIYMALYFVAAAT